jgi:hypothetical protein
MRLISAASKGVLDLYYDYLIDKPICGVVVEEIYNSNMQALESFVLKSVSDDQDRVTDVCVTGFFKHCRESGGVVATLFETGNADGLGKILQRLMGTAAGSRDLSWFYDNWAENIIKVCARFLLRFRTLLMLLLSLESSFLSLRLIPRFLESCSLGQSHQRRINQRRRSLPSSYI